MEAKIKANQTISYFLHTYCNVNPRKSIAKSDTLFFHSLVHSNVVIDRIISTLNMELQELYNELKFARRKLTLKKKISIKKTNYHRFDRLFEDEHLKNVLGITTSVIYS